MTEVDTFEEQDRPMLIFVSDIHLTDQLHGATIGKAEAFGRFWTRIQAARGKRPAQLCFVGDLFDLVRSPTWLDSAYRPYHDPDERVAEVIDQIVTGILDREKVFFGALRQKVEAGELEIHYVLGNHDRLLRFAPKSRRKIWKALTGRDEDVEFPNEIAFPQHKVLAYHGNLGDPVNYHPDGAATVGDAIGLELITRFPRLVKRIVDADHAELLDDIDDVRPIFAVPAWVRNLGVVERELMRPVGDTWSRLVEEFLSKPFVKNWIRDQKGHSKFRINTGTKLKLMLELSTKKVIAKGQDQRLTKMYKMVQHSFDGKMAERGAEELMKRKGIRYVVNGHSHFASMVPLGRIGGEAAAYFNTGTWRTVHQIGNLVGGRPSFLPFDSMSYLVFFPEGDELGRDYEWWNGAMVART